MGAISSSPAFMPCIWSRQLRAYWIMVISKYLKYSLGLILFSIILNYLVICNHANHTFLLVQTMTWQDRQKEEDHRERFRKAVTRGQADCWCDRREEEDEGGEEKDKEWQGKKKCRHHTSNIKPQRFYQSPLTSLCQDGCHQPHRSVHLWAVAIRF